MDSCRVFVQGRLPCDGHAMVKQRVVCIAILTRGCLEMMFNQQMVSF